LFETAVPLALADDMKAGISTTENLMVPKRLALCQKIGNPLAAFGVVCGMVFPILMFPMAILFGLAELLIPEFARCAAAGSEQRIRYLAKRSLRLAMLYGCIFCGILYLLGDELCIWLYNNRDAGMYLKRFAILAPMLYCDAITDAMVKGLGQQVKSVRYNIITSVVDVLLLFYLLPKYGMEGYYVSFVISHLLNFILSVRLLMKHIDSLIPIKMPVFTLVATLISVGVADSFSNVLVSCVVYFAVQVSLMFLLRILCMEDMRWIRGLLSYKKVS
jgi:stage V sporulation protein B